MRGKEYKLENNNKYKAKLGTVDNTNPTCFYFTIKGWATPKLDDEDVNYKGVIRQLRKQINTTLYQNTDTTIFSDTMKIVDLDLRESGIRYGKKSYFNCEITLYQNDTKPLTELLPFIQTLTNNISHEVLESSKYFTFTSKK